MTDLLVAGCASKAATYAVMHWHYSKRMPVGKTYRLGVWEHGRFVGCVLFGWGSNYQLGPSFGLAMTEVAELTRIALTVHDHPVSQIVTRAMVQLRTDNPGLRLVVSYADPNASHHGGIYQAMNWLYLGTSQERRGWILPDGTFLHRRAATAGSFGGRELYGPPKGSTKVTNGPGKHRYAYPLDRQMRRKLTPLAKPYPRGSSVEGDTSAVQAEEPGSTPGNRSTVES